MDDLFEYIECIKNTDVTGVKPLIYPFDKELLLRDDVPSYANFKETFLKNVPESYEDFVVSPRTIG